MRKEVGKSNAAAVRGNLSCQFAADTRDHLVGRRDMMVGLWAGEQLGLSEESRAIYAMEVMAAGLFETEAHDVVDKVSRDFTKSGIPITRGQILVEVSKKHRLAVARLAAKK